MVGLVVGADLRISPVHSGEVLRQVVGADAGEIHFPCRLVRQERDGGDLHHNAHLQVGAEGDALSCQLSLGAFQAAFGPADIVHAGDHGEHQPQVSVDRRSQRRAELRAEHVRMLEAEAQGPVSQEGIVFLGDVKAVQRLVAADIKGAQDYGTAAVGHQDLAVCLELLLLRGQRAAAHVQKF